MEQAIQQKKMLDKTIMQCIFIGIPRSGKTSLMKRMVGEDLPHISPSTGVANKPVQVLVRSSAAVSKADSTWTKLKGNEEAAILVMDTSRHHLGPGDGDSTPVMNTSQSHLDPGGGGSTPITGTSQSHSDSGGGNPTPIVNTSQSNLNPGGGDSTISTAVPRTETSSLDICRRAIQDARKILLQENWLVYLTDTGGQIEFQELLPQLVSGPSIFFLVFRLDRKLNKQFKIKYVHSDGRKERLGKSTLTVQQALMKSLASIASIASEETQVFLVGTHSDNVTPRKINGIDHTLHQLIESTDLNIFPDGFKLLAVDNKSRYGIEMVQKALEQLDKDKFNVRASPSWLIFGLVIQEEKESVLSHKRCLEIAKNCNINIARPEELNEALSFLHTKVGLIRHFQKVELEEFVILNPQVLFDVVTELVEKTFTLKDKVIFPFSTLKNISSKHKLNQLWLAKLLKHLNIIAPLKEKKNGEERQERYFMPCVLARAQPAKATSFFCREQSAEQIPSLLICFTCGYCPVGLFAALVVHLLVEKGWTLQQHKIFNNQISFTMGPCYTVSIKVSPAFFKITCTPPSSEVADIDPFEICGEIRDCIKTGISQVTSDLNYKDCLPYLAFECSKHRYRNQSEFHPAVVHDRHGKLFLEACDGSKPSILKCKHDGSDLRLPHGYEMWFPKVYSSNYYHCRAHLYCHMVGSSCKLQSLKNMPMGNKLKELFKEGWAYIFLRVVIFLLHPPHM